MGLQLGLSAATLDEIGGGRDDASNCRRDVLQEWLESSNEPCAKAKIVKAIRCPTIKIMWLAKKQNNTGKLIITGKQMHAHTVSQFKLVNGLPIVCPLNVPILTLLTLLCNSG